MTDELPDHLERLPVKPCSELKDEIWHEGRRYKPIPLDEEQNRGGESIDSPRPAQETSAFIAGPGEFFIQTPDGWLSLGTAPGRYLTLDTKSLRPTDTLDAEVVGDVLDADEVA